MDEINEELRAPQNGVSGRSKGGFGCEFCTKARAFGSERGLSQHQRQAHPGEYNRILQDRDLKRQRGSRTLKCWTESELKLWL